MKTTYKIMLRKSFTKNDGTHPIYLRLTIQRKSKTYTLGVACLVSSWNEAKSEVKTSTPDHRKINLKISNARTRVEKIIFDYEVNNKTLTFVDFEREFFAPVFKTNSFYEYVNYSIKHNAGILSKETTRSHAAHLSKLKTFRPNLAFNEISTHFLDAYRYYMKKTLENNENTINKTLSFIKVMVHRAIRDGVLKQDPLKGYKLKKIEGNREYLTLQELTQLENMLKKKLTPGQRNVLKYFLFSCYTGLRYQDLKNLKYQDINDGVIVIIMHKTKDRVSVPIISKAKALLGEGFPEQNVFKVKANQVTNRYLKELTGKTQIKKKISFHCARHTFATVGLELGIPIEYISDLLGHKDLRTTKIYAKILDYKKIEEMKKWEKL